MRIVEIIPEYINYLYKFDKRVSLEHPNGKTRKFIGITFSSNKSGLLYFVPLSSPDKSDYNNGKLRKSFFPCIYRITRYNKKKEEHVFMGKLLFNNMIPVLDSVIKDYDIKNEVDEKYKMLLDNQVRSLRKPYYNGTLNKNADKIYMDKINHINKNYLKATVDFMLLEKKCRDWEMLHNIVITDPKKTVAG